MRDNDKPRLVAKFLLLVHHSYSRNFSRPLSISRVRDASPSRGHALSVAAVVLPIEKGIFEGLIEAESSSSLPNSSGTGAASVSNPNPGAFFAHNSLGRLRANRAHPCLATGYHTPSPVPLQPFRF